MRFIVCPYCDYMMTEPDSECPPRVERYCYQVYDEMFGDLDCEEWEMECGMCGKRFCVQVERRPDYHTHKLLDEW